MLHNTITNKFIVHFNRYKYTYDNDKSKIVVQ